MVNFYCQTRVGRLSGQFGMGSRRSRLRFSFGPIMVSFRIPVRFATRFAERFAVCCDDPQVKFSQQNALPTRLRETESLFRPLFTFPKPARPRDARGKFLRVFFARFFGILLSQAMRNSQRFSGFVC